MFRIKTNLLNRNKHYKIQVTQTLKMITDKIPSLALKVLSTLLWNNHSADQCRQTNREEVLSRSLGNRSVANKMPRQLIAWWCNNVSEITGSPTGGDRIRILTPIKKAMNPTRWTVLAAAEMVKNVLLIYKVQRWSTHTSTCNETQCESLLPIFIALSRSLHRYPSAAQGHIHTIHPT